LYCARCGAKNPEDAKFCQKCGARLTYEVTGRGGLMDKKYWALTILVLVVGGYASYYAYAMTILVPKDLKTFKDELEAMEEPFITPSEIKEMEEIRSMLEGVDLKVIPAEGRKQGAEELRSEMSLKELQEFKYNCSRNREKTWLSDMMFY